jgi:hypothetical protein
MRSLAAWPLGVSLFVCSLHYQREAFAQEPDLTERVATAEARRTHTVTALR